MTPTNQREPTAIEKWIELMLHTLNRHLILHMNGNMTTLPTKMVIGRNKDAMRAGANVHANHIKAIDGAIARLIDTAHNRVIDLKRELDRTPWYKFRIRREFGRVIYQVQTEERAFRTAIWAIHMTFPPVIPKTSPTNGKAPAPHG